MAAVLDQNEVMLFGTRFPILGPVQRSLLDSFPAKVVFGDYTRDDEVIVPSWVQGDWSGGVGVENGKSPDFDTRYFWGDLDTRFPNRLALNPLVTHRSLLGPADSIFTWNGHLYITIGTDVYEWDESSGDTIAEGEGDPPPDEPLGSSIHTLASNVSDYEIFMGTVYLAILGSNDIETFGDSGWSTSHLADGVYASLLKVWNGTLYAMSSSHVLYSSTDGSTWTEVQTLDLEEGNVTQLYVGFDINGDPTLYAATSSGIWAYDSGTGLWIETQITFPPHPLVGKGAMWQGSFYLPVGSAVYRTDAQSVQPVGPDRDEGLPSDFRGYISQIIASHGFIFATIYPAIDASQDPISIIYTGYITNDSFFSGIASRGAVLVSDGTGWHFTFILPGTNDFPGAATVTTAQNTYRYWFSSTSGMYSIDLPTGLNNPARDPTVQFQPSGSLYSSWFNAAWYDQQKLALEAKAIAHNCSSTEIINIYAQWDDDQSGWDLLGTISSDGLSVFGTSLETGGKPFLKVRFRIDMQRGSDITKSPVLESLALSFVRRPKPMWGAQFVVDLSKQNYKGNTPGQLRQKLEDILSSVTAGQFLYRPEDTIDIRSSLVLPGTAQSTELTGLKREGRFPMSVIQLESSLSGN